MDYRKNQHFRETRSKNRKLTYFHNALNKYGFENFEFKIIDEAFAQEDLDEKERFWIKFFGSTDKSKGYNLDSGGNSGGKKSDETKQKIGLTTKEKWKDPVMSEKMRNGLLKGAETMKKNKKRFPFICPTCGRTFYYPKHIAESKKYCSLKCATNSESWKKGVLSSSKLTHEKNIERKKIIKDDIIQWALSHQDIVLNCPYNKITSTLCDLKEMLFQKYGIKDLRSVFICFNVKNLKTFLDKLKEVINISKENIC